MDHINVSKSNNIIFTIQVTVTETPDHSIITDKIKTCSEIVFKGIMQYCMKTLQIQSESCLAEYDVDDEDIYCTILYNDETHTFEQVIFNTDLS